MSRSFARHPTRWGSPASPLRPIDLHVGPDHYPPGHFWIPSYQVARIQIISEPTDPPSTGT